MKNFCQLKSLNDERQQLTKVFAKAGLDNVTSTNVHASAAVRAGLLLFSFLLLTSTLFFQLGICTGLDVQ
jgi:hypothetical protein